MNIAFAIGCSHYDDPDIADLKYAHEDAIRFGEVLRATCGLGDDEILVLHDGHPDPRHAPTRANILRQIARGTQVAQSVTVDLLYFFFSGHGFRSTSAQADYLLTQDAVTTALEDSALRFDTIVQRLQAWEPRHVLLFLDACRASISGGKAALSDELPNVDVASLCPSGMVSFCSCEPGRSSYESDALRAGIFTAGVCDALSDHGKCKTIYELDAYLARTVPQLSKQYDRPVQRPYTRVEPLGVQRLELVSARKRNEWRAATPIGAELRSARVPGPRRPSRQQQPICAIDLGTSYSVVSVLDETRSVRLIPSPEGQRLVPSVLNFNRELDYLVGLPALEAERYRPHSTVRHVKRALGSGIFYEVEGRSLDPEFAASLILRSLKRNAEEFLGVQVERCIASYPANFSIAQTNALQRAFELADLEVVRMVGEPNVASHLLTRTNPDWEGNCLVVDLGGGTFDVAIVNVGDRVLDLQAVAGSSRIGGLDYDEALAGHVERQLREQVPGIGDELTLAVKRQIRREAERAKRALGSRERTSILLQDLELDDGGFRDLELPVDRALFRTLTAELNSQVDQTIEHAFEIFRTGTPRGRIDLVLLAGQGSKIFTVAEILERRGLDAPFMTQFQETAVVHGLAYQAGVLLGEVRDVLLIDVVHRDLGFRVLPNAPADANPVLSRDEAENTDTITILGRSSTIPTRRSEIVTVKGAGSAPVTLQIVQPAGGYLAQEETIGSVRFRVEGAETQLELEFHLDANSTLELRVTDHKHKWIRVFQLNNLYLDVGLSVGERLERLLEGFTVWTTRKITHPEAGDDDGLTLERLDIDAEVRDLERRLEELRRAAGTPQGESAAQRQEVQASYLRAIDRYTALRDRLLVAKGRRRHPLDTVRRRIERFRAVD